MRAKSIRCCMALAPALLAALAAISVASAGAAAGPLGVGLPGSPALGFSLAGTHSVGPKQITKAGARSKYEKGLLRAGIEPYSKHPSETRPYASCHAPSALRASCLGVVVPTEDGEPVVEPQLEGSGEEGGFSPADLRSAYNLPDEGGEGKTIAITIAYDDPNAESDLAVYRETYGLPPCTTANGCFKKVNQKGEEGNYPAPNADWALETSLDLDMVSAACPSCSILLVEADSNFISDLYPTIEKAAELGADVISDSWATGEYPEEVADDHYFDPSGVPVLFASGDWGYGALFPAASPKVVAVGGTSLEKAENPRGWSETAWGGAGSGCSEYEEKPAWQTDEGCDMRTVADVSAVADPFTPVSVYDSYESPEPWWLVGGTSASTPLLAGVEALSSSEFRSAGPSAFQRAGGGGQLFDVTAGVNGYCGTYLCQAGPGYDGPTGWGTPDGALSLPVAVTETATIDSATEATLHGAVNPKGLATQYRFEYGETTAYGSSVPIPDGALGSGGEYVVVSQPVQGLKERTNYHYRIVATNANGTFSGIDRTFGTSPPTATTDPATEVHANDATLNASVNPEGGVTSYYFEFGFTPSYGRYMPATHVGSPQPKDIGSGTKALGVSAVAGALSPNKTYHFRVVAVNPAGVDHGEDRTFTTEPSEWTAQPTPSPEKKAELQDISCVSQHYCMALGVSAGSGSGLHRFTDEWNGKEWTVRKMPEVPGADETGPASISCASTIWCVSVGRVFPTEDHTAWVALAEHWDGNEWKIDLLPVPSGAIQSTLLDVSCVSSSNCMAVGDLKLSNGSYPMLVEHWDGEEWSMTTLYPPDTFIGGFDGVSCVGPSFCLAVGYDNAGGWHALAERWDGENWALIQNFHPAGAQYGGLLTGVSCSAVDDCTALGLLNSKEELATERWNGKSWAIKPPLPSAAGVEKSTPLGISCPGDATCMISGSSRFISSRRVPLAYRQSDGETNIQSTQPFGEEDSFLPLSKLSQVSCVSPSWCMAAGAYLNHTAATWKTMVELYVAPGPASKTDRATAVDWNSATLHATVNPNGLDTTYQFEYTDGSNFDEEGFGNASKTPASPKGIGAGTEDVALSTSIGSLEPGTTYRFRVTATNAEGTTYGEDIKFRTRPMAPPHFRLAFGEVGVGAGQLSEPLGLAIDPEGNVWVADTGNNRIQKFSREGKPLLQVGAKGSGAGQFGVGSPSDVATGADGNVWVVDGANDRIEKFSPQGEYLAQLGEKGSGEGQLEAPRGLATDADGNVWVADSANERIQKFDPEGELLLQFATGDEPSDVARGPEGNVWVAEGEANRIAKFDPEGEELTQVGSEGSSQGQFNSPTGIAVDVNGNVWVADAGNDRIQVLDSEGEYVTEFGEAGSGNGQFSYPANIALDSEGDAWAADSTNDRVQEWIYGLVARTEPASGVKLTEATLNATLNPDGLSTAYRFEYDTAEYKAGEAPHGTRVPVPDKAVGAGIEDVEVSQAIGGLAAGTIYHFRVVARNDEGTVYGKDQQFTTPGPKAIAEGASGVTWHGATLHASVNPNGLETAYRFEYDTAAYKAGEAPHGTSIPVPDKAIGSGSQAVEVEDPVEGLDPETTYHFRVVATNAEGAAYGEDKSFTTYSQGWKLQQTDDSPESSTHLLRDVSCASASECIAVGGIGSGGTGGALAERWDGSEWGTTASPEGKYLTDVSCISPSFCLAVPGEGLTAQRFEGESWKVASLVSPAGKTEKIAPRDISCVSASACIAVGGYRASGTWLAFSESWDGSKWTLLSTPAGKEGGNDDLNAVSCDAVDSCTAIGRKDGKAISLGAPLALRWDGSEWSALADPKKAAGEFSAISCTAPSQCVAVFGGAQIERWDGSEWASATLPAPEGGSSPALRSVSCPAEDSCVAVGSYALAGKTVTLAGTWDGGEWAAQRPINPEGSESPLLSGVSCSASHLCAAVGYYNESTFSFESFAERYDRRPDVETKSAVGVTARAAVLHATVNPNGLETAYRFEYDTAAYKAGEAPHGTSIPVPDKAIGSGSQAVEVEDPVEGLDPETTYHFRVVATNAEGAAYGKDETFATPIAPGPQATTEAATALTPTSATLNASVDANGLPTAYRFEGWREDWQKEAAPARTNLWPNPYGAGLSAEGVLKDQQESVQAVKLPDMTGLPAGIDTGFLVKGGATNSKVGITLPVVKGTTYRWSVYFKRKKASTDTTNLRAVATSNFYSGGTLKATSSTFTKEAKAQFTRYDLSFTADETATWSLRLQSFGSEAEEYYVTAVLVEASSELGTYFPNPVELESGQAVANENGTYTMATPSYAPASKEGDAGKGTEAVAVSEPVTGLKASTAYRYRVVAANAEGTAYGGAKAFTTPAPGPQATTDPATNLTSTTATLNASVDANGLQSAYWFERWQENWQAAGAPSRTNLAHSPSAEGTYVGWGAAGTGVSASQTQAEAYDRTSSIKVTTPGSAKQEGLSINENVNGGYQPLPEGAGPGKPLTVSTYVKAPEGAKLELRLWAREGAGKANVLNQAAYLTGDGKWQRASLSVSELPAGAKEIWVLLRTSNQVAAQALTFYADAALFESSAALGSFFPLSHELESGQAVANGDGTHTMATPSYAPASKEGDAGKGTEAAKVSQALTGLSPSTAYRYRVVAANAEGTAYGEAKAFTTPAP